MKYTKFGRTGLTVSRLCLGTGTFGTQADETVAYQILAHGFPHHCLRSRGFRTPNKRPGLVNRGRRAAVPTLGA